MRGLPSVTVVTPTWQRHDLLLDRCIPSVLAQDYQGEIEHIVVSGPDPELPALLGARAPHVTYAEMAVNVADGGATPRRLGCEIASGDLVAYLDDDVAYRPRHVSCLVAALDGGAEFAFSQMQAWHGGVPAYTIGTPPPAHGAIDTSLIMNRRGLLEKATWEKFTGSRTGDPDADLVARWMEAGVAWAFAGEVTVDYWVGEPGGSRA